MINSLWGGNNLNIQLSEVANGCCNYIKFQDFIIYFNNEESAIQTLTEVFGNGYYHFETNKEDPLIIDAGSNIGIATLFFKKRYPAAKIICFEPDPNAFAIHKLNVEVNHLTDITMINAALSATEGMIDFYGQIHGENPDARGNSIIDIWGAQRAIYNKIQVQSVRLSSYIHSDIDFLKIDIEGAEEQVLTELGDKLKLVKAIGIEFHEAEKMQHINSLDRIKSLLSHYHFDYELIPNDISIFPESVKEWANKINPHLYTIKAIQKL